MMIEHTTDHDEERAAWVDHIAGEAATAAQSGSASLLGPAQCREIAEAIVAWLERHGDLREVLADELVFLIGRALWAVGGDAMARGYVRSGGRDLGLPDYGADLVCMPSVCPAFWRLCVRGRLMRPGRTVLSDGALWLVDFERMAAHVDIRMDLMLFQFLARLLDMVAGAWDRTCGRGILGLLRLGAVVRHGAGRGRSAALRAEVVEFCSNRLEHAGRQRGWTDFPDVVVFKS